jgi:uncharacterized protein (DUF433 family)
MSVVETPPDILDATPVFRGTRVPVQALIDHIQGGDTLNDFLTDFPTVTRQQVIAFLESARDRLLSSAS